MSAPPGLTATTEPPGEHITGARVTDLATKSGQERYLVHELGVTYPQAKALIRAYEEDLRDAVIEADRERSFLAWLMQQAPGGRKRATQKWRVGESGWRTRS